MDSGTVISIKVLLRETYFLVESKNLKWRVNSAKKI